MNYNELVFFDLETSGLDPEENDIIQIAAVDAVSGDEFCQKVRFKLCNASKEALRINGYDEEVWQKQAVSQREAFQLFREFIVGHAKQMRMSKKTGKEYPVAVMAGHNIDKFDMQFLKIWELRLNGWLPIDYACYDTLQLARWLLPELESHKLVDLAKYFDVHEGKNHDALDDVRNNIRVASKLVAMLNNSLPVWAK